VSLAPQATAHAKHVLLDTMQLWQGCLNARSVLKARSRVQAARSHAASVVLGQQAHQVSLAPQATTHAKRVPLENILQF